MPIRYTVDRAKRIILEVWEGQVDADCLEAYWRQCLQDPEVLSMRRTLVDLRRAEMQFSGADLNFLIQTVVLPVLQGRDWKSALVVEHPVQFGVCRQYQVFAERYSHDSIFDDLEKARLWLEKASD